MIRTINSSFGPLHYAVCHECKKETPMISSGVQYSDDAAPNVAPPHGWITETYLDMRNRTIQIYYCPQCAIDPEHRTAP